MLEGTRSLRDHLDVVVSTIERTGSLRDNLDVVVGNRSLHWSKERLFEGLRITRLFIENAILVHGAQAQRQHQTCAEEEKVELYL